MASSFLDEIGEIEPAVQVKFLRVIRERRFRRLRETEDRRFQGKLVAATNRDLPAEMDASRFREDLYYRLCADVIETPSLAGQLRDSPGEFSELLRLVAARVAGPRRRTRWPGRPGAGSPSTSARLPVAGQRAGARAVLAERDAPG